ncbi:restriction endonuclease subunit S [Microbacterium sp. 3H14]|uniref:restriction endonuclease subunit S n=1 Tax=unclassified Microbacterium TaxID=2609290 RepID=UPI0010694D49|nr:restriction endonuclease subunit S [Microbacterium sp. 3H14]TFB16434.1 restriction endonuclease subunit S [Microbacterium sp. 3H14]
MKSRTVASWPKTTFGRLARIGNGADYSGVEVEHGGYPVYGSGGEFRRASSYLFDGESVLFGRKGTVDRPLHVSGKFWTVDTMFYSVIDRSRLLPRFAYYWATTLPFRAWATDTALPSMTSSAIKAAPIMLPPMMEQRAIADYLDRETAQIDAFIAKNEELIALLTERRASSIVELIGSHETIPLKRLVSPRRPLTYGILQCGEPVENGIPYIGPSDLPGEGVSPVLASLRRTTPEIAAAYRRSVLAGGDIVVSIGPAFGRVGLLSDDLAGANLTQDTVRVAAMPEKIDAHYLVWVLSSRIADDFWDYEILGATFRRLNLGTLGETPIPLPSVDEQQRIAGMVDDAVAKIDTAINVARQAVKLASERRTALISAAVTGKIDVREAA